jgi:mono/diheme cytochrome c family protein
MEKRDLRNRRIHDGVHLVAGAIALCLIGAFATAAEKGKKAEAAAEKAKTDAAAAGGAQPTKNFSFVKDIAPILVAKCAKCHIDQAKGKFSMATFESLKKGSPDGAVYSPGKGTGSRIVDLIETGDMPRAGPKVTKPELAAITKWIDEGAKFDGGDEKTPLVKLVGGDVKANAKSADEPKLSVVEATGKETVQFSKDIAPMLVQNCFSCHAGQQPTGQFQMATFAQMIRGGQSGNPWVPYKPDESLIIKKLKGLAGARMPQPKDRPPLPADVIAKFEKWIAEGARFDGPDAKQSTQLLAALTKTKSESSEELSADRQAAAKRMWAMADPSDVPAIRETKNLIIVSSLPPALFDEMAVVAEEQAAAVAKQFHVPADQPLVKGRVTLFVFPTRYYFSEFGRMVENHKVSADSRGSWKFDVINAYAAVVSPGDGADYSLPGIVGQELASVYVASLAGKPPEWFSEGSGRVIASRLDPKAARVRQWNDRIKQLAGGGKLDTFISRGLSPDDTDVAAYSFVKELMASGGKYSSLILALRNGDEFAPAFAKAYGNSAQAMAVVWAKIAK